MGDARRGVFRSVSEDGVARIEGGSRRRRAVGGGGSSAEVAGGAAARGGRRGRRRCVGADRERAGSELPEDATHHRDEGGGQRESLLLPLHCRAAAARRRVSQTMTLVPDGYEVQ